MLEFSKIKTNEEIIDITKHIENGWTTCGEPYFAVVLKNKEIRALYNDEDNNFKIGTFDYSIIADAFESPIILYKDGTISEYYVNGDKFTDKYNAKVNTKIKYNNKELIVDKLYYLESSENDDLLLDTMFIVSNNKLYKLVVTHGGAEIK